MRPLGKAAVGWGAFGLVMGLVFIWFDDTITVTPFPLMELMGFVMFSVFFGVFNHWLQRKYDAEDADLDAAALDPSATELGATWIETLKTGGNIKLSMSFGVTLTPGGVEWNTLFVSKTIRWADIEEVTRSRLTHNGMSIARVVNISSQGQRDRSILCTKDNFDDVLATCCEMARWIQAESSSQSETD